MNSIKSLMSKKVSRKEFLVIVAVLVLGITGISSIFKNAEGYLNKKSSRGFGSGPYGI